MDTALEIVNSFSDGTFPPALASLPGSPAYKSAWDETIKAADEANDPGRFTAFIAMNGRRIPAATTFTAMLSSAMTA